MVGITIHSCRRKTILIFPTWERAYRLAHIRHLSTLILGIQRRRQQVLPRDTNSHRHSRNLRKKHLLAMMLGLQG